MPHRKQRLLAGKQRLLAVLVAVLAVCGVTLLTDSAQVAHATSAAQAASAVQAVPAAPAAQAAQAAPAAPAAALDRSTTCNWYWLDATNIGADLTFTYSGGYSAVSYRVTRWDDGEWYVDPWSIRFGVERLYARSLLGYQDSFGGGSQWESKGTVWSLRLYNRYRGTYQTCSRAS